jgi:hypothetical protein
MVLVVSQTHYAISGLGTATSISTAVGTISSKKAELQNKIDLLNDIEGIIEQAKEETKNEVEEGISKKRRIQNIRDNRNFEKQQERKQNIIEIRPEEQNIVVEEKAYGDAEQNLVELLLKAQKEGKDRAGFDT